MKTKKSLIGYSDHDWWLKWIKDPFLGTSQASAAKLFKNSEKGTRKDGTPFKKPVKLRITIEEVK